MNATDDSIPVTQEFFDNVLLEKTSGIEEFGTMRWPLFGLLVLTWVLIYLFVFKGTKSIGKVVYVTAIAPYIMLIVRIWKFQVKCVVRNSSVFSNIFISFNSFANSWMHTRRCWSGYRLFSWYQWEGRLVKTHRYSSLG